MDAFVSRTTCFQWVVWIDRFVSRCWKQQSFVMRWSRYITAFAGVSPVYYLCFHLFTYFSGFRHYVCHCLFAVYSTHQKKVSVKIGFGNKNEIILLFDYLFMSLFHWTTGIPGSIDDKDFWAKWIHVYIQKTYRRYVVRQSFLCIFNGSRRHKICDKSCYITDQTNEPHCWCVQHHILLPF